MMHPACELRWVSDEVGYGVFAGVPIPRGTVTWARDDLDQVVAPARVAALPDVVRAQVELYSYIDPQGRYVMCWDLGKYVNHSCNPTSRGLGDEAEVAVRDIAAGEHMTSDYAELNIMTRFVCRCGAAGCRGGVGPDDLPQHFREWDQAVQQALPRIAEVPQALWPLLRNPDEILAAAAGRAPLASRLTYRWQGLPPGPLTPR